MTKEDREKSVITFVNTKQKWLNEKVAELLPKKNFLLIQSESTNRQQKTNHTFALVVGHEATKIYEQTNSLPAVVDYIHEQFLVGL